MPATYGTTYTFGNIVTNTVVPFRYKYNCVTRIQTTSQTPVSYRNLYFCMLFCFDSSNPPQNSTFKYRVPKSDESARIISFFTDWVWLLGLGMGQ